MNKLIAPAEVRAKHLENLRKTRAEIAQANEMMDQLIAHLDAEIAAQPQRAKHSKRMFEKSGKV
ncbi:hypothetical protein RIVM261_089010 [Rivularia sp. IAM M-261]|nr:hypothetical protein RIVM261_089010 [Rivularia sp. IAM M-261]